MADSDGRTTSSSTSSIAVDNGVPQLWQTGGNPLKLRYTGTFNINQMVEQRNREAICRVTPDGRVMKDDIDITDDNAAMAECFIKYLAMQGVKVNRGS